MARAIQSEPVRPKGLRGVAIRIRSGDVEEAAGFEHTPNLHQRLYRTIEMLDDMIHRDDIDALIRHLTPAGIIRQIGFMPAGRDLRYQLGVEIEADGAAAELLPALVQS